MRNGIASQADAVAAGCAGGRGELLARQLVQRVVSLRLAVQEGWRQAQAGRHRQAQAIGDEARDLAGGLGHGAARLHAAPQLLQRQGVEAGDGQPARRRGEQIGDAGIVAPQPGDRGGEAAGDAGQGIAGGRCIGQRRYGEDGRRQQQVGTRIQRCLLRQGSQRYAQRGGDGAEAVAGRGDVADGAGAEVEDQCHARAQRARRRIRPDQLGRRGLPAPASAGRIRVAGGDGRQRIAGLDHGGQAADLQRQRTVQRIRGVRQRHVVRVDGVAGPVEGGDDAGDAVAWLQRIAVIVEGIDGRLQQRAADQAEDVDEDEGRHRFGVSVVLRQQRGLGGRLAYLGGHLAQHAGHRAAVLFRRRRVGLEVDRLRAGAALRVGDVQPQPVEQRE